MGTDSTDHCGEDGGMMKLKTLLGLLDGFSNEIDGLDEFDVMALDDATVCNLQVTSLRQIVIDRKDKIILFRNGIYHNSQ